VQHQVADLTPNSIRLVLWEGVDGFHEWCWGDGWVQSRLEGISVLPINLGQSLNLFRLQRFLAQQPVAATAMSQGDRVG